MTDSTPITPPTRIFLSYARGDDEAFVKRLHADLTAAGFTVWFDRESLLARGLNFHQEIKDAIRTEVDRVVYVGGPKAALSAYVREEWQFALECDQVVVTPILRLGDYETCVPGELGLLHCEDFSDDAKYPASLGKLIENLRQPNPKLGALFAVPNLPPHFLGRPDLMRRVRDALLVDLQKPQVITSADAKVGMQGMGGIGKSVLAAALARNREVRQSYPDGIIWISCGQELTRDDLLARLRDVAKDLGGDTGFDSIPQGQGVLRELLQPKAVLLVLDDVWQSSDAQTFDLLGPRCRMLVTTRDAGILHALHGELVPVSLFTESEALQLLADAVGLERSALLSEALEVVRECGCLPLAVALSGGMAKAGHSWNDIVEALREADLEWAENRAEANEQHRSIWNAMKASYDALPDNEKPRFAELAVFATDRTVPEAAVHVLWEHTGALSGRNCTKLLINLAERSLVRLDEKPDADGKMRRRVSLHDLLHDYAVRVAGEPKALHQILVDAYQKKCPDGWHSGPNDGYYLEEFCNHLIMLENWGQLIGDAEQPGVLTDLRFIEVKCAAGWVHELVRDYNAAFEALPEFREEQASLRVRDEAMFRYNRALRDYAVKRSEWRDNRERCESLPEPEYPLLPLELTSDSGREIPEERSERAARLRHYSNFVNSHLGLLASNPYDILPVAYNYADVSPVTAEAERRLAGRIVSWLRRSPRPLASFLRPQCLRTIEDARALSVSINPDGRWMISGNWDNTLGVWQMDTTECLRRLEGHAGAVNSVCVTLDGRRAISGSDDMTLRLWDLETGICLRTLEGHGSRLWSVSVSPDGRCAISGSSDKTLRLWDLETGICLRTLEGHTGAVNSVCVTPDGRRAISGSGDTTLRLWDLETGRCLRTLEGHTGSINSICVTPDGRCTISASDDTTLRLWDLEAGICLRTFKGHSRQVRSVSISPDSRKAVSDGYDFTVRIWDLETGVHLHDIDYNQDIHIQCFPGVTISPNGRWAVSCTGGIRVFDLRPGAYARPHARLALWDRDVLISPNARWAISAVESGRFIRIWDIDSGSCLRTFKPIFGLTPPIAADSWLQDLNISSDAQRVILCYEVGVAQSGQHRHSNLQVWDMTTGRCLRTLEGLHNRVRSVAIHPDGSRVILGSGLGLWLWDLETGECLPISDGYTNNVSCVSFSPDSRKVVSVDRESGNRDNSVMAWDLETGKSLNFIEGNNLRVWDLETRQCLHVIEGLRGNIVKALISPDGHFAVLVHDISSDDKTLRVLDLETGICLRTLEGHRKAVYCVCIGPDGRTAVSVDHGSGEMDTVIRVWDLPTGVCLRSLTGHSSYIHNMSISPDGRCAVSAGTYDKTIRVWDIGTGECLTVYHTSSGVDSMSVSPAWDRVVCSSRDAQLHFLTPVNFPPARPAILTATNPDSARCPCCAHDVLPAPEITATILSHTATLLPGQSPCLDLPDSAFDDPRLLTNCPHCAKPLKFNPFFMDRR